MSIYPVTFVQTPGPLGALYQAGGSSHAAIIPLTPTVSLVILSGQPGFSLDSNPPELVDGPSTTFTAEAAACFDCIEAALKAAGVPHGLRSVFKMTAYLTDVRDEAEMMRVWRDRTPDHRPAWVTVGVAQLAVPGMRMEISAEALITTEGACTT